MSCKGACEGCALSPGAAANREPHNHLKAMICVLGAIPFHCHEGFDWTDDRQFVKSRRELKAMGALTICQGWRREVAALARTGFYRERRHITRVVAQSAFNSLIVFLGTDDPAAKERARSNLDGCLRMLVEERREYLKAE